jgi:hypothetical protein
MAEYIEREKVVELFNKWADGYSYIEVPTKDAIACVRAIPAADVRPVVKGRWKLASYSGKFGNAKEKWYDQFLDGAFWYCDQCRERARKSNFCPNCGADMREGS